MSVQPYSHLESQTTPRHNFVTPEAYLEQERQSETKSEYHDGEIVAMAGASLVHNEITANMTALLRVALRGKPCRSYTSDLRVQSADTANYFYPDLVVVCGKPDMSGETLKNPAVIIEVLSRSTEPTDRGEKFRQYQRIPSLREYVLVAQDQAAVERYVRQGESNLWLYSLTAGTEATVILETIGDTVSGGVSLPLSEIYDGVDFSTASRSDAATPTPEA